jgi:hypothetical protein
VSGLVGDWLYSNPSEGEQVRIVLQRDGRYVATMTSGEDSRESRGTWRVKDGKILTREDGEEEDEVLNYKMPDRDTLEVTDEHGEGIRMVRQR